MSSDRERYALLVLEKTPPFQKYGPDFLTVFKRLSHSTFSITSTKPQDKILLLFWYAVRHTFIKSNTATKKADLQTFLTV